jgi:hypothetical protein
LGELLSVPAHSSPDLHAFLRSKGHRVELDLAATALAVARTCSGTRRDSSVGKMEALMELRPDPAEWVAELGPRLKKVLEMSQVQASFAKFFKGHRHLDFEITANVPADAFAALRAMGGSCGCRTFLTAMHAPNTVEHARAVWAAMADAEQGRFRQEANRGILDWVPDIDVHKLKLIRLELGVLLSDQSSKYPNAWNRCFTPELARFILEYKIKTPAAVLDLATACGHLDVVKLVAPACTMADLQERLSRLHSGRASAAVRAFIAHTIAERTHPMLRWLTRLLRL